jgi:hypothetical protein
MTDPGNQPLGSCRTPRSRRDAIHPRNGLVAPFEMAVPVNDKRSQLGDIES